MIKGEIHHTLEYETHFLRKTRKELNSNLLITDIVENVEFNTKQREEEKGIQEWEHNNGYPNGSEFIKAKSNNKQASLTSIAIVFTVIAFAIFYLIEHFQ